jgi:hypothetical protein
MRVYLLGAGFNLAIGPPVGRKPFLAKSFFKVLLADADFREKVSRDAQDLTSYIESYWKYTSENLANEDFDLEECYTLLELQRTDLQNKTSAPRSNLKLFRTS